MLFKLKFVFFNEVLTMCYYSSTIMCHTLTSPYLLRGQPGCPLSSKLKAWVGNKRYSFSIAKYFYIHVQCK